MPIVPISKFFNELDKTLDEKDASFEDRVGEHMAYRAALYLIRGEDADPLERDVDSDQLMAYANQLKRLGIKEYAKHCYGGMDPDRVDLKNLKYEYFLYHNVNRMQLVNEDEKYVVRSELRENLREQERDGSVMFADHWLSRYNDQEAARNAGDCREEDKSVYEYEAPDDVWKDYVAGAFYRRNQGVYRASGTNVGRFKDSPFDKLTLRNKRTVEHVRRGELDDVAAARKKTEQSFTFVKAKDLAAAQERARTLSQQMAACTGAVAETPEWRALKSAVSSFQTAESPQKAAEASAKVLLAVEKFTKGKKNANQPQEVKNCVNLALQSLGTTIPDAARNPSVTPLIDRFNNVRRHRLQYGSMVTLEDNHALSRAASDQEILEREREQVDDFVTNVLNAENAQAPMEEAVLTENVARAIALEQAADGMINLKADGCDRRVEELKKDPVVQDIVRELRTDESELAKARRNKTAKAFGYYLGTKYGIYKERRKQEEKEQQYRDDMSKKREEIRKLQEEKEKLEQIYREGRRPKEQLLQRDTDQLRTQLEDELDDLNSDYYKINRFDPQRAGEMFAGLLAMNEIKKRQEAGEKLGPDDLRDRIEELKKDPVVARMAETLPGDPKFRNYLEKCREKNVTYGPTVTTALTKAYESYSRGKLVSEYIAEQRENVRIFTGGVSENQDLTPQQSAKLAAKLIALREIELMNGGKDVPVDEKRLEQRIGELEKEPGIQDLGEKLIGPNYQSQLRKLSDGRIDPERNITNVVFNTFRKEHPDKILQQPKPEEIKPPAEEIGAPVV